MKISEIKNKISFFGRVAETENCDAVFFNWSGSGFAFRFKGTSAKCRLLGAIGEEEVPFVNDRAYISVFIDDIPFATARFEVNQTSGEYILAENLPFGEHTVYVFKDTEVGYGRVAVEELFADGELLEKPKPQPLKIEFIGDSITCGYGNICSTASSEFVTREESFTQTFAFLTSRILKADISVVSASGNGFYHDYGCNTHNLIPELYEYADKLLHDHCGQTAQKWDFSKDKCDLTVVKLGQNDAQYCMGANLPEAERTESVISERKEEFYKSARAFFEKISNLRKNTPILLIFESDMYLKNEVIRASQDADCSIQTLEFVNKREYEGVGANGHYSVYTHARVANLVANKIREILC